MSSSRPPEAGTELPDRADLPDDEGAGALDIFPEGVGFRDEGDDPMTYAVAGTFCCHAASRGRSGRRRRRPGAAGPAAR